MPKNTPHGLIIGALAFVFGFAMVWYIWWLAVFGALGILAMVIARCMGRRHPLDRARRRG